MPQGNGVSGAKDRIYGRKVKQIHYYQKCTQSQITLNTWLNLLEVVSISSFPESPKINAVYCRSDGTNSVQLQCIMGELRIGHLLYTYYWITFFNHLLHLLCHYVIITAEGRKCVQHDHRLWCREKKGSNQHVCKHWVEEQWPLDLCGPFFFYFYMQRLEKCPGLYSDWRINLKLAFTSLETAMTLNKNPLSLYICLGLFLAPDWTTKMRTLVKVTHLNQCESFSSHVPVSDDLV